MTGTHYLILAYIVGLALLWGYAIALWLTCRAQRGRVPDNH
jgi:hypothetical protein